MEQRMAIPYASATSDGRARDEITKILRRFGCESVGFMDDFDKHEVLLAFTPRGRPIQLRASAKGWAQMVLKENPWTSRPHRHPARLRAQGAPAGPHRRQLDPARLDQGRGDGGRVRDPVVRCGLHAVYADAR